MGELTAMQNDTEGDVVDIGGRLRTEILKNELLAAVSHEFRAPLTSIIGALGLLVGNQAATLPGSALRLITIAHANSQRLARLVNSIVAVEQIEPGKARLVLQPAEVQQATGDYASASDAGRPVYVQLRT